MTELSYALEQTKKFTKAVLADPKLKSILVCGPYNFLQLYEPLIFLDFRKHYKRKNKIISSESRQGGTSKIFFGFWTIILSFLAIILAKVSRRKILIFSNDVINSRFKGDFRLAGIYEYLESKNLGFIEVLFSANDSRVLKNFWQRKRLAVYYQMIDIFYKMFGKKDFVVMSFDFDFGADEKIMNHILHNCLKGIPKTMFRIQCFEKILGFIGIQKILTIDSVRRYGELLASAKKLGITTLAFQHGQFTKYQTGWLDMTRETKNIIKPDKFFVWSRYWQEELFRLGTYYSSLEIEFCENAKGNFSYQPVYKKEARARGVLIVYETDAPKDLAKKYIQEIIESKKFKLYFKPRPDKDIKVQLVEYGLVDYEDLFEIVFDLDKVQEKLGAVLGFQSTILYEMIQNEVPVGVLESELDYTEGLLRRGFAEKVSLGQVCAVLDILIKKDGQTLSTFKEKFIGGKIKGLHEVLDDYLK